MSHAQAPSHAARVKRGALRLLGDSRGAVSVEYASLVGCIALTIFLAFARFGAEVTTKVECQARAVLALSTVDCAEPPAVDIEGVDVEDTSAEPAAEEEEERDCSGWRRATCALSDVVDTLGDVTESVVDTVGDVTASVASTVGDVLGVIGEAGKDLLAGVGRVVEDTLNQLANLTGVSWLLYYGGDLFWTGPPPPNVGQAWSELLSSMAPLVGLGGDGAPGVLSSWGNLLFDTFAIKDFQNGDYAYAVGKIIPNVASLIFGPKIKLPHHGPDTDTGPSPPAVRDPRDFPSEGFNYQPNYRGDGVTPLPGLGLRHVVPAYHNEHRPGAYRAQPNWVVQYLTPEARAQLELRVQDGRVVDADGNPYTSGNSNGPNPKGDSIWVLSPDGRLYAYGGEQTGTFHHSSFLAGSPVSGAGHVTVKDGRITEISDLSGHYQPDLDTSIAAIRHMQSQGIDLSGATFTSFYIQQPVSVTDLLAGNYTRR